jgi:hypothetical protein
MNKLFLTAATAAVAMAVVVAAPAAASTVTFDSTASENIGPTADGYSYSEAGLTFTSSSHGELYHWGASDPFNADAGGATLFQRFGQQSLAITRTDGGAFLLNSIDVAEVYNDGSIGAINYSWIDGGGSHAGVFDLDSLIGLQTFGLNLAGVTSFTIDQAAPFFQIDNVVSDVGGVPEASTWALMLLGFGLTGVAMRGRRALAS